MARHESEPILDGNLIRIFSRLYLWNFLPFQSGERSLLKEAASWSEKRMATLSRSPDGTGRTVAKYKRRFVAVVLSATNAAPAMKTDCRFSPRREKTFRNMARCYPCH
jgi:hypothetical protein